jgi:hypothetical protein
MIDKEGSSSKREEREREERNNERKVNGGERASMRGSLERDSWSSEFQR